jgi:hypothetical protein
MTELVEGLGTLLRSYLMNGLSNEISTFRTGAEAQICVETAIYVGSKEPAPPTEVGGFHLPS